MSATRPRRRPAPVTDHRTGTPSQQLARDLRRMRDRGMPFDQAWDIALSRVRWPHDTASRQGEKAIMVAFRSRFQSSYERMNASSLESAGAILAA